MTPSFNLEDFEPTKDFLRSYLVDSTYYQAFGENSIKKLLKDNKLNDEALKDRETYNKIRYGLMKILHYKIEGMLYQSFHLYPSSFADEISSIQHDIIQSYLQNLDMKILADYFLQNY